MKKLVKLAFIVGGVTLVAKVLAHRKSHWSGLSEAEVRQKLDARMPRQVPENKRSTIADEVVSKMRSKGMLGEDEPSPPADDVGGEEGPTTSDPENGDDTEDTTDSA